MTSSPAKPLSRAVVLRRGVAQRCPKCGQGAIYSAYLKPVVVCAACGESFADIRADDGPAWLTIMVTGHMAVPVAIYMAMHDTGHPALALLGMVLATIGLALLILPRAKSIFIGMIWFNKTFKTAGNGKYDRLLKE